MEKLRKFETEEVYGNASLEYPTVSYTEDTDKVWIKSNIKFYFYVFDIEGGNNEGKYIYDNGMTWENYVNSSYNTKFSIDENGYIHIPPKSSDLFSLGFSGGKVSKNDLIIPYDENDGETRYILSFRS